MKTCYTVYYIEDEDTCRMSLDPKHLERIYSLADVYPEPTRAVYFSGGKKEKSNTCGIVSRFGTVDQAMRWLVTGEDGW